MCHASLREINFITVGHKQTITAAEQLTTAWKLWCSGFFFLPELKVCFSFYFSSCNVTSCLWHVHRSKVFSPLTGDIICSCTVSKVTELSFAMVVMVSLCALNLGYPVVYLTSKTLASSCVWLCRFQSPHCAMARKSRWTNFSGGHLRYAAFRNQQHSRSQP